MKMLRSRRRTLSRAEPYDAMSLHGFAGALGVGGYTRKGDGVHVTEDMCMVLTARDGHRIVRQLQNLGYKMTQDLTATAVSFQGLLAQGRVAFDCFRPGDAVLTVDNQG